MGRAGVVLCLVAATVLMVPEGALGREGRRVAVRGATKAGATKMDTTGLVVSVRPTGPYTVDGPVVVEVEVVNPTLAERVFCRYHTPFEGIRNDIFQVIDAAGARLPYGGMMAKRAAPGPGDFVRLKPGQRLVASVDLRDGWKLEGGSYRVSFPGNAVSGLPGSGTVDLVVKRPPRSLTTLEVEPVNFAEGPVVLRFSVRNPTTEPLRICRYYTPLEGLMNDVLDLRTAAGAPVPFTGPQASRPAPGPADYVTLAPGATVEGRVDLRQYYALTAGAYVVGFPGNDDLPASERIRFRVR